MLIKNLPKPSREKLDSLRLARAKYKHDQVALEAKLREQVESALLEQENAIGRLVAELKFSGVPVTLISEAYGTKNRNTIYEVLKGNSDFLDVLESSREVEVSPFSWLWVTAEEFMSNGRLQDYMPNGWYFKIDFTQTPGEWGETKLIGWGMYSPTRNEAHGNEWEFSNLSVRSNGDPSNGYMPFGDELRFPASVAWSATPSTNKKRPALFKEIQDWLDSNPKPAVDTGKSKAQSEPTYEEWEYEA